mgnify:CR=1 FL=1
MNTYTLLLVDDEEEVVQVIRKKINWEGLGFSVIGYANNGVKALDMIEEFQPDVVMTDIKMPYMDGMELCKHIREEYPATKIILFTGFDEFEYAKEAVHLEIEEYILKPLNSVELTDVLTQLKIKLDREISEKRSAQILQVNYQESLPFLRANFYSTLIEGKIHDDEVSKYISDYQIGLTGPYFSCLVIHTSSGQVPQGMSPQLVTTAVYRQVKEKLEENWRAKTFSYLGNTVMLAQLTEETEVTKLTDECDRFCRYANRIIGAVVTVGIGQVCNDILELSQSYTSAREAVSYRVIYGTSRAINMKEIAPGKGNTPITLTDETELSPLFKMIRLGAEQDIIDAVDLYFKRVFLPAKSLTQHHIAVMELICSLYRFAVNNEIEAAEFSGELRTVYNRLVDHDLNTLKEWMTNISLAFHEKMVRARNTSTKTLIQRAEDYVHHNYRDADLSLDSICKVLGVSNSYFSSVFKKETGNSFIGYITDYRMDKAARLLIETNEKSYMIAKSVGYTDPNYFSYVFKRQFGVSPSKYRTEYADSEG